MMFPHATAGATRNREGLNEARFELQLFAGDGGSTDDGDQSGDGGTNNNEVEMPKTVEELQKLLQSEADRRVNDALKTAQGKWEEKLKEERENAARLAKLTAAEKEKELLKLQAAEIAKREQALAQRELELKTIDLLQEKKLPIEFRDFVIGTDEAATIVRIDAFQKLFQASTQALVDEKLKGKAPGQGDKESDQGGDLGSQMAKSRNEKADAKSLWEV